jgi:hypothetical protein
MIQFIGGRISQMIQKIDAKINIDRCTLFAKTLLAFLQWKDLDRKQTEVTVPNTEIF